MDLQQKEAILRRVLFLKHLPEAAMQAVLKNVQVKRFERGATLFCEKERPQGLHVVAQGQVRVCKIDRRGRELVLSIEREGDPIVELPNFDGGNYPASAQAMTPVQTLFLEQAAFNRLLSDHPEIAMQVIRALAIKMRRLMAQVEQFSLQSVRERLIRYLLERASEQGVEMEVRTSKEAIAAELGTVREVVSRTLRQLYREGLIDLRGQKITLRDYEKLRRAAEAE